MRYEERYFVEYRRHKGPEGQTEGEFGPFDIEEDALKIFGDIVRGHNYVSDVYHAEVIRTSSVTLRTFTTGRRG